MAFHSKSDSHQAELPTMSFPTKVPLRPLIIPDPDPDKDLAPVMPFNNLKPDCLLSPANPARWKGASNRARFGLDIGGTLCKVVYFEPFDDFGSCTPLSTGAGYSTSLEHGHKLSEDCCCLSGSTFRDFCDDTKLATQDLSSSTKENSEQDCLSNADGMSDTRVPGLCQLSQLHLRGCETDVDNLNRGQSLSHVQKIWKPSHDPVLLPGRGTLHFKCFETWRMEEFLFLSKEHSLVTDKRALGATGGGAKKFINQFLDIAGLRLCRADELKSLVRGIDFLMKHAQRESFEYPKGSFQGGVIQRPLKSPEDHSGNDGEEDFFEEEGLVPIAEKESRSMPGIEEMQEMDYGDGALQNAQQGLYPYLVVNIGSGVSILLVESPDQFKRVGGTSLGGSTFFGLASILTGCTSFEEAIDLAAEGDSTEIDMLVGDIYGGDYSEMGLAATTVASSFGKLVHPTRRAVAMKNPQHLAKAALIMITNNIGSLAKLHAQATGVHHVLFTGSFMHGNKLAMRLLTVAMEFWSKGQIKAIFLRHEGHAGAMGALLSALDPTNPTDALLLSL